ncbi:hypothetical protein GCM10010252_27530 [Streptomyces aureoverticillatus]|nr:hypothetical protein GCM10010252_27530 [Streptomyces aureoverticillatus]
MPELKSGTVGDLETLFVECRAEMTGKARSLLAAADVPECVADADDIVSTAFAKALRDPAALHDARAWLYQVIRTDVAYLARRRARRGQLEERRAADPLRVDPLVVADFSALVANREVVHKAVLELSAQQRVAVWATHAMDYTRNEVAVLMGKHPGTVARHSSRALLLLRASITTAVVGVLSALGMRVGAQRQVTPADDAGDDPTASAPPWGIQQGVICACIVILTAWALWTQRGRIRLLLTRNDRRPRGRHARRRFFRPKAPSAPSGYLLRCPCTRGLVPHRKHADNAYICTSCGRVQNALDMGAPGTDPGAQLSAPSVAPSHPETPEFTQQNSVALRAAWLRAVEQVGAVPEPTRIEALPGHLVVGLADRGAWEQFEPSVRSLTRALERELGQPISLIATFDRQEPLDTADLDIPPSVDSRQPSDGAGVTEAAVTR